MDHARTDDVERRTSAEVTLDDNREVHVGAEVESDAVGATERLMGSTTRRRSHGCDGVCDSSKTARQPSPTNLITRPPWDSIASAIKR